MGSQAIILDTCIFIDYLRGYTPAAAFIENVNPEQVIFSAISEAELLRGSYNNDPKIREKLLHFLAIFEKIDVTNPIALKGGDISRWYNIKVPDAIIAATAIHENALLVTKNVKDFMGITGLELKEPY